LVLDAGDALLNDKDPAKSTRGESSVALMNAIGYDAVTLGLKDVTNLSVDELRQRIEQAEFPMLSANIYVGDSEELLAEPYVVLSVADHKVGIVGLTDTGETEGVTITDPLEAAREWVPRVQQEADIIIVLSHAGLETDQEIAANVPGIDVFVSGGNTTSSQPLVVSSTGTVLFHAATSRPGYAGEQVGLGRLSFSKEGQLTDHEWQRIVLDTAFEDDPEIAALVQEFKAAAE
jgi:2',3'-cyclic-nucleotide 2'-phosphodiesterase (5'-nucleotidase family)